MVSEFVEDKQMVQLQFSVSAMTADKSLKRQKDNLYETSELGLMLEAAGSR